MFFRLLCIQLLICCCMARAEGQLTTRNANGKAATLYSNAKGVRDTIFAFNQTPQIRNGDLSLRQTGTNTFRWYEFDYTNKVFKSTPFFSESNVSVSSQNNLTQGGYKVTVTSSGETAPRDSFVAWLYMNPGFEFNIYKDDNGELMYNYKTCNYTNFILRPNTVQSSFTYYNPDDTRKNTLTFDNKITFTMKPGNAYEVVTSLNTQGNNQYLRHNEPPYEDTRYYFRAYDMFGIERKDEIMYRTIIPYVIINTPILPEKDPSSAPVPVKFTYKPYNVTEYEWYFGDGDSVMYNLEFLPPDTVKHTYTTPKRTGYQMTLMVTSMNGCIFTTDPVKITVDDPYLEVGNVFTPNGDTVNDYFKPQVVSLRQFEITIFTRTGKQVYRHRGNDLRDWIGWDGRIENTGNEASPGVYFYVIKAIGWDEPPTKKPPVGPYSGSFHLYR